MQRKLIVEKDFWELFPDAKIGVVVAKKLNNVYFNQPAFENLLRLAEGTVKAAVTEDPVSQSPYLAVWREAYKKFKAKKGRRASIESLTKRVVKGGQVPTINPLVDLYNAVSLQNMLPAGGEDLAAVEGHIRLTRAVGGEEFVPLGEEQSDPPAAGEVVYKDDIGVICRCWNWREAHRTRLTRDTTEAVLVIESVDSARDENLLIAVSALAQLLVEHTGAHCRVKVLSKDLTEMLIDVE